MTSKAADNVRLFVVPKHELSKQAALLKETLAMLAVCCDEIATISHTSKTTAGYFPKTLALAVKGLFLFSSSEVYRELFGEYPQTGAEGQPIRCRKGGASL